MKQHETALYFGNFDLLNGYASIARIFNISLILREKGFDTIAPCFHYDDLRFKNEFGSDGPLVLIDRPIISKIKLYTENKYYLDLIIKYHPKIVFLYDFPSFPYMKVLKYCNKHNIKVVADCTEWYDSKCVKGFVQKIVKKLDVFFRMRIFNKRTDGVICVSEYLEKYYSKSTTIRIPPLMKHLELIDVCNRSPNDNRINLFYAGNTNSSKDNVVNFIKWLIRYKPNDVYFHLFGNFKVKIKKDSDYSYFKKHVICHGNINHIELIKSIRAFDCQLIIRKNSRANKAGFPSKFAECTMLSIPCYVTEVGDVGKLVSDSVNGYSDSWKKVNYGDFIKRIRLSDISEIKKNVRLCRNLFLPKQYSTAFEIFLKKIGIYD